MIYQQGLPPVMISREDGQASVATSRNHRKTLITWLTCQPYAAPRPALTHLCLDRQDSGNEILAISSRSDTVQVARGHYDACSGMIHASAPECSSLSALLQQQFVSRARVHRCSVNRVRSDPEKASSTYMRGASTFRVDLQCRMGPFQKVACLAGALGDRL